MAKTKISEYDATAANNTDIDSINIAEGMAPSNVNNAIRELMAHLKDGLGAGTPVYLDATNNRVGVGTTSPTTALDVAGTVTADGLTVDGDAASTLEQIALSNNNSSFASGLKISASFDSDNEEYGNLTWTPRNGTQGYFQINNLLGGSLVKALEIDGNDISFFEDTGTTAKFFWDASIETLTLGSDEWPSSTISENAGRHMINYNGEPRLLLWDASTGAAGNEAHIMIGGKPASSATQFSGSTISAGVENGTDADGYLAFSTTNASSTSVEHMRITSDGSVGIGTSSPSYALSVARTTTGTHAIDAVNNTTGAGSTRLILRNPSSDTNGNGFQIINNANDGNVNLLNYKNTALAFWTNGSERMRVHNDGNVSIGTTSKIGLLNIGSDTAYLVLDSTSSVRASIQSYSNQPLHINKLGNNTIINNDGGDMHVGFTSYSSLGSTNTGCRLSSAGTTNALARGSNGTILQFYSGSGGAGYISVSGNTASYNTSSDYRLKENVETLTGAITRVKALKPKRFSWIEDDLDSANVDGFLAHEAQTVVPEAVTGTHNETTPTGDVTDEDGNVVEATIPEPEELQGGHTWTATGGSEPVYQGIDQSKLVPLLTAALQEAIAKIETLETKVAALESA